LAYHQFRQQKEEIVMTKKLRKKHCLPAVWVILLWCLSHAPATVAAEPSDRQRVREARSAEQLIDIYSTSDDSITRRRAIQALQQLTDSAAGGQGLAKAREAEPAAPSGADGIHELLDLGLQDPKASVVKEAIRQVGNLRLESYGETLVELYDTADSRFPGSQKEIQSQIIESLGKIGGGDARELFRSILVSGVVSFRSNRALLALREMQDASLLDAVEIYAENVEDRMAAIGNTPDTRPRYAWYQQSLQLARSVQLLLSGR
jgi:HEAT repeat protein